MDTEVAATTVEYDLARARRVYVVVQGVVQGVGFRPFVYRLATRLGLTGWVNNTSQGVLIDIEGDAGRVNTFLARLVEEAPPRAVITSVEVSERAPAGFSAFEVRHSDDSGAKTTLILPDMATCPDCLRELFDPLNRRHRYPFTNCTNCGPRFSIIQALPYDRPHTTMRGFTLCPECQHEYDNPLDRRFHAQPNACPACGPRLALWSTDGRVLAERDAALLEAAEHLRAGRIVALKGLGGFQLLVDARDEQAVARLRQRKLREAKPFALMFPSLAAVRAVCAVSDQEAALLVSPEAPIVLLRRLAAGEDSWITPGVAPGNPFLGAMLPYTPLHHLLMADLGFPVIATSGNRSDEPICIDEYEALARLRDIADVLLVHDRPIARYVDDSVVRVLLGAPQVLRRARGYAPLPVHIHRETDAPPILALGGHLKNAVALAVGQHVFVSQHIGDLETAPARDAFTRIAADLPGLYDVQPAVVACDAHPDYASTLHARRLAQHPVLVQHHAAHVLACMAEHGLDAPVLGVAWDGTGYGGDGTIWGGEFLCVTGTGWRRVAHLRTFSLPGGEVAVREPRRSALGMIHEHIGDALWTMPGLAPLDAFTPQERAVLRSMLEGQVNAPRTSAAGRLFDALAALVGLRQRTQFEGQAAMELEWTQDGVAAERVYPFVLHDESAVHTLDWGPLLDAVLDDLHADVSVAQIAARIHRTFAEMIVAVGTRVGVERVVLTGGCFQNRTLTELAVAELRAAGFRPYWHQQVPPNDGGIALGQVAAVARGCVSTSNHIESSTSSEGCAKVAERL